ncbi:MAG TPA: hypothetical protein DDZ76_11320 [Xanthomonadales bacterium]|nr:hypothetical protein [Xanthomonadales bacterium]
MSSSKPTGSPVGHAQRFREAQCRIAKVLTNGARVLDFGDLRQTHLPNAVRAWRGPQVLVLSRLKPIVGDDGRVES